MMDGSCQPVLEYDVRPGLTVRGGIAYEKSPIREASQRLTAVP